MPLVVQHEDDVVEGVHELVEQGLGIHSLERRLVRGDGFWLLGGDRASVSDPNSGFCRFRLRLGSGLELDDGLQDGTGGFHRLGGCGGGNRSGRTRRNRNRRGRSRTWRHRRRNGGRSRGGNRSGRTRRNRNRRCGSRGRDCRRRNGDRSGCGCRGRSEDGDGIGRSRWRWDFGDGRLGRRRNGSGGCGGGTVGRGCGVLPGNPEGYGGALRRRRGNGRRLAHPDLFRRGGRRRDLRRGSGRTCVGFCFFLKPQCHGILPVDVRAVGAQDNAGNLANPMP